MICQELFSEACPCIRAELAECEYCSLLRAEAVCGCDWQGRCLYELYKWREKPLAAAPVGTVAAVRSFAAATGLIVKADAALTAAPLGTAVSLPLPPSGRAGAPAVLLGLYPQAGFVYLLLPAAYDAAFFADRTLALKPDGNVLAGYPTLVAARDQNIVLTADAALIEALAPLAATLRRQGNRVTCLKAADRPPATTDILFVAGADSEIKRAATKLPPSFKGKLVSFTIEGLSLQ